MDEQIKRLEDTITAQTNNMRDLEKSMSKLEVQILMAMRATAAGPDGFSEQQEKIYKKLVRQQEEEEARWLQLRKEKEADSRKLRDLYMERVKVRLFVQFSLYHPCYVSQCHIYLAARGRPPWHFL